MLGPTVWRERLAAYGWDARGIGKSGADVYRLHCPGHPTLFVKRETLGSFSELARETKVLRWLAQMDFPAPRIVDACVEDDSQWLLMTALPGTDMASTPTVSPDQLARECASALRRLHAVDPALCPFNRRLVVVIPLAERRVNGGIVDETDFDDQHLGKTANQLFAALISRVTVETDIVVCHGDACMPNFTVADGAFSGLLDCGRLGVADKHQDLALATRSIASNFGPELVPAFLSGYGITPDDEKIAFYRLLR